MERRRQQATNGGARGNGPSSLRGNVEAHVAPPAETRRAPNPGKGSNPFDRPVESFRGDLDRISANHRALIRWAQDTLSAETDYAVLEQGAKPTLLKPGAEKVVAALGLRAHFPNLPDYERAAMSGQRFETVILTCQLLDSNGGVVAEGAGARQLSQDSEGGRPNLNTTLKMAAKSAYIDGALRAAGLSEAFTQDLDDILRARKKRDRRPPAPDYFGEVKKMVAENATSWAAVGKLLDRIEPAARGQARKARPESLKQVLAELRAPASAPASKPAQGEPGPRASEANFEVLKKTLDAAESIEAVHALMRSMSKSAYSDEQKAQMAALANEKRQSLHAAADARPAVKAVVEESEPEDASPIPS